jgi:hypothetical protein
VISIVTLTTECARDDGKGNPMSVRSALPGLLGALLVAVAVVSAPSATAAVEHLLPHQAPPAPAPGPAWAPAASAAIRPGVLTETAGGGACTANFVFTAGERVYLGQAAHCAGTGEATETDGCDSGTGPLGSPVTIRAADGTARRGTLAYSSWVTMQQLGETDPDVCQFNDFALVELNPADVPAVNPSMPFFGGPTGVDDDGLTPGEPVFTYGNSPQQLGIATLSPKAGIGDAEEGGGFGHEVYTMVPGVPGDSGSAFVDAAGRAVGIMSTLNLAPLPVSNGVIDLRRALDYASAHGGLGTVELVPGTEPFTDAPPNVDPMLLITPAGPGI